MKITLKNVKYSEFASQETYCFEATIYLDGKKAGQVRNDGQEFYRNKAGRCEDAPCCGCCTI